MVMERNYRLNKSKNVAKTKVEIEKRMWTQLKRHFGIENKM